MSVGAAPTILITRPEPGASATADRLRALGFNAIVLPFTEMHPKKYSLDSVDAGKFDAVVVTSANALRFLADVDRDALLPLPVYTVGDATMAMARELGFNRITSADGNARDLASLVCSTLKPNSRLIYLCGETRTSDIEEKLDAAQLKVHVLETYKTVNISQLTDKLIECLSSNQIDAIVFYSSISAKIFTETYEQSNFTQVFDIQRYFCISERARSRLSKQFLSRVTVAPQPRDDEMIELLRGQYFG